MPSRRVSVGGIPFRSMSRKLVHYLRNERRRRALTQADVAALLGGRWKGRVAWYERGALPPTEVALEYEAILGKPVSELFGGSFAKAALNVRRRAQELLRRDTAPNTPRRWRRHHALEGIGA
jgi:transcriptional regulator with XRE-family HTH domain